MFKIASWNVNSLRIRLVHTLNWLSDHSPDLLALQETKLVDEKFPIDDFKKIGYFSSFSGQKTYNGVATLSRKKTKKISTILPDFPDQQRRILVVQLDELCIINLYAPNGAAVGSDKYDYKLKWFAHLKDYICNLKQRYEKLIVLGDFNIAPEDRDVHDPKEWEGKVLISDRERDAFAQLLDIGFQDCFRLFKQKERSFSWWDYRAAAFRRNRGLRIDHILASNNLAKCSAACYIDKVPRGLARPSDHTPVVGVFNL